MSSAPTLASLPEGRRALLLEMKRAGASTIGELAERLGVTYEAARQQLRQLELEGWASRRQEARTGGPGRPGSRFRLTPAGEHLFPKAYDELAVDLLDAAADRMGPEAVRSLLAALTERKISSWRPKVEGKTLPERLRILSSVYSEEDPFCFVDESVPDRPRLVEINCPFHDVAQRRPILCSVTVSVLRSLLDREVARVQRFQQGHGRCVFEVGRPLSAAERERLFVEEPSAPLEPARSEADERSSHNKKENA